jgi:hypothetical protein
MAFASIDATVAYNNAQTKLNKVFFKVLGNGHGTMAQIKLAFSAVTAELTHEIVTLNAEKYEKQLRNWPTLHGITERISQENLNINILQAQSALMMIPKRYPESVLKPKIAKRMRKAQDYLREAFALNNDIANSWS